MRVTDKDLQGLSFIQQFYIVFLIGLPKFLLENVRLLLYIQKGEGWKISDHIGCIMDIKINLFSSTFFAWMFSMNSFQRISHNAATDQQRPNVHHATRLYLNIQIKYLQQQNQNNLMAEYPLTCFGTPCFLPYFQKETFFVTFCLLSWVNKPFYKGTCKEKNLVQEGQILSFKELTLLNRKARMKMVEFLPLKVSQV